MATTRIRQAVTGRGYFVEKKDGMGTWRVVEYCFTLWGARWRANRLHTFTPRIEEIEVAEREK